jgi:hypothetical protein
MTVAQARETQERQAAKSIPTSSGCHHSVPAREYEESVNKVRAVLRALEPAEKGV